MRDVIMFFPILGDFGINYPTIAIEKRHGTSVFTPWAKNPLEGRQLTAIASQHLLLTSQISQGLRIFPAHANEHPRTAILVEVEIWWRVSGEVSTSGEVAEIAGVGSCRPSAAEKIGMRHLYPHSRPPSG